MKLVLYFLVLFVSAKAWPYNLKFVDKAKDLSNQQKRVIKKVFTRDYLLEKNKDDVKKSASLRLERIKQSLFAQKLDKPLEAILWPDERYIFEVYGEEIFREERN